MVIFMANFGLDLCGPPEAACRANPPVSEVVGPPIASAPLSCATRLRRFFAFAVAFSFACWTCFRARFFCAVFLGLISFLRSLFVLGFFNLGLFDLGFFRHFCGCHGRSFRWRDSYWAFLSCCFGFLLGLFLRCLYAFLAAFSYQEVVLRTCFGVVENVVR